MLGALQVAVNVPQRGQILDREKSAIGKRGIKARRGMALGEDEAVALRILGVLRVDPQFPVIQVSKQVRSRQASAGMAGLGSMGGLDHAHTDLAGFFL